MQGEEESKLSLPTGKKGNTHIYSCYNSYSCQRGEWIIFSHTNHRYGTVRTGRKTLLLHSESHTLCFLIFCMDRSTHICTYRNIQRALQKLD